MPETQEFGAGNLDDASITAADLAADSVEASEIAAGAVGLSEIAAGIIPYCQTIRCVAPSSVRLLGRTVAPAALTVSNVVLNLTTLHTANADAFAFNVVQGTAQDAIFSANQVVTRNEAIGNACKKTLDSPLGNDEGTFTTYAAGAADISSLDTAANGDFFYVGYTQPFGGAAVDTPTNDAVSVMTAKYWNGSAWAALTITDGTDVAGDTMKQTGDVTWSVPADWASKAIDGVGAYWVRFQFSAPLDATTTIVGITAIRAIGVGYTFTPDQFLTVVAGVDIRVSCTEADANAVIGDVTIIGTYDMT